MPETPQTFYTTKAKHALGIAGSVLLLVITAPVQALCAIAVVVDDGRPVLHHQSRTGKEGQVFALHRFRTQKVGTDKAFGGYPTADAVTKVGRVLRRLSVDEFPQLVNILRGQMSFVGPRPAPPSQVSRYAAGQRGRPVVRPGLTGLAQIRHRTTAPWSQRITTDLEYVHGLSLRMDLAILVRTTPSAWSNEGMLEWQTEAQFNDLGAEDISSGQIHA
jgi:lipopolysaccharide/colanic/teichoic acid biosynthesis glycosyltransferase